MSFQQHKLLTVVGARPQFVKAAVLSRYLRENSAGKQWREVLVHTGQHYDVEMSDGCFQQLEIPVPGYNLEVGSQASATQLARIIERLAPVVESEKPDLILVYGDTHPTVATALVAAHLNVPLVHVQAGERIYRRFEVPEEVNRVLTDHAASLCLTCTERATNYLLREGMAPGRVRFVGDLMYELFCWAKQRVGSHAKLTPSSFGLEPGKYILATIHRAQNTRDAATILGLLDALDRAPYPVLLPVHPRVRRMLDGAGWEPRESLRMTEPLAYFDFLSLLLQCRSTVTDSGGVTRESFWAGKPCVVPMQNCWWPDIVEAGWIYEAGAEPEAVLQALREFEPLQPAPTGMFGDGRASEKVVAALTSFQEKDRETRWHRLGTFSELPAAQATDFTYGNYRKLLSSLQEARYRFLSFPQAADALQAGGPFVLLRHDVDIDLEPALRIAEVEHELGVRSTFFFLVCTDTYNLFSQAGSATVRRILELGHGLGLHFDCAAYSGEVTVQHLAEMCGREASMLETWFGQPVTTVSYHRPNDLVLSGDPALSLPRVHTYQKLFTGPILYLSDSRGTWGRGSPLESGAFAERRPLHILVHPVWWNERPVGNFEVLERYADRRSEVVSLELARNCTVYRVGRLREIS